MPEPFRLQQEFFTTWPAILGIDFLRYLIAAGTLVLVVWIWRRDAWSHRKIRRSFPRAEQIVREIRYSLLTVVIISLVGFGIYLGAKTGVLHVYEDASGYGWTYVLLSTFAAIVAHDTYFYWSHRLMHQPRLFGLFHRLHHRSYNPSPWAAYAFAPLEAVVQAMFLPLFLFIVPMHALAIALFLGHMIIRNAIGHCGYELWPRGMADHPVLGWVTGVTHHDQHHATAGYNFGLYFTWWDRLMGTEHPRYRHCFAQVTQRRLLRLKHLRSTV